MPIDTDVRVHIIMCKKPPKFSPFLPDPVRCSQEKMGWPTSKWRTQRMLSLEQFVVNIRPGAPLDARYRRCPEAPLGVATG